MTLKTHISNENSPLQGCLWFREIATWVETTADLCLLLKLKTRFAIIKKPARLNDTLGIKHYKYHNGL